MVNPDMRQNHPGAHHELDALRSQWPATGAVEVKGGAWLAVAPALAELFARTPVSVEDPSFGTDVRALEPVAPDVVVERPATARPSRGRLAYHAYAGRR